MTRIPTYLDGKPTNLQAAIVDAEYWLRWLRSQINDPYRAEMKSKVSTGLRSAIQVLEEFLPPEDASINASPPPPRDDRGSTIRRLKGSETVKARYCKVCSCELDEFNLAKQGDHTCRKCKEARIKEKLRARQQRMELES